MADKESKRREAIESLLAERKKYETWLTQLEAKRGSTAGHVFARVHADYTTRLDAVRERLGAEADGIRSLVGDLEARLATEETSVTEKTDERAELELRAAVGEFSEKEWNSTRAKLDSAIDELRSKFGATARELAEMKETLESVLAAPRTPAMDSGAVDAGERPDAAVVEPAAGAGGEAHTSVMGHAAQAAKAAQPFAARGSQMVEAPPARKPTPFDELAFLKSVAGTPVTPVPSQPAKGGSAKAAKVAEPAPEPAVETVAQPIEEAAVEAEEGAPGPEPEPPFAVFEPPMADEPDPESEPAPRPRASSKTPYEPSALGAPTPRTSQAIRSLKCQECGTLNFPTEWYCERCGGELAAF